MKVLEVTKEYYHTTLGILEKRLRGFISDAVKAENYYLVFEGLPIGGFAITDDGWILGLFSLKKGKGKELIPLAIKYAENALKYPEQKVKVFCTGDFLRKLYESYDFEVYDTIKWDNRQAPKVWDKEEFGTPDLYNMRMQK